MKTNYDVRKKLRKFSVNRDKKGFEELLNTKSDSAPGFISISIRNGWYDITKTLINEFEIDHGDFELGMSDLLFENHSRKDPDLSKLLVDMAKNPKLDPSYFNNILIEQAISNKDIDVIEALLLHPSMKLPGFSYYGDPNIIENIKTLAANSGRIEILNHLQTNLSKNGDKNPI